MNALLDEFPTAVEIGGAEYELNSDFRVGLKIMLAFEDPELTEFEKRAVMLRLLYKEMQPDPVKAAEMAVRFLDCGEERRPGSGDGERLFSWSKDARYIYSAIKQTHGIDLETVGYLHWWKFIYLFLDLRENCFFCRLIYYRKKRSKGKLTKEEREYCAAISDILDLPQVLTTEDQRTVDEFYAQLK